MIYIKNIELPIQEFKHPLQMYPNLGMQDIHPAQYRSVGGFENNPDICALPPLLSDRELVADNMHPILGYDPVKAMSAAKSDRLAALATYKDSLVVYMPFHSDLERRFQECLISAYSNRSYGSLNESSEDIISIAPSIATSVQDMSVIGMAGTGKSTAVRLMLNRYPRAIQHDLKGIRYTQVPYLAVTAREGDIKSVFLDLAMALDRILGVDVYEHMMRKAATVSKMETYLATLIRNFHIGAIIIDEIQMVLHRKESMFTHILSVTASTGVSVIIIGTEAAVSGLNKNLWFSRRFSQIGQVRSDIRVEDTSHIEQVIRAIWKYQWTKKQYPLTKAIISALVRACHNNIDFLTTIIITAQTMCIKSEGSEEELELTASTIKLAAEKYPAACRVLEEGAEELEASYLLERRSALEAIANESILEKKREQAALMKSSVTMFSDKAQLLNEIFDVCNQAGFGNDKELIEFIVRSKSASDEDFLGLSRSQQAKIVISEILKNGGHKKKTNSQAKKRPSTDKKTLKQEDTKGLEDRKHGLDELQAAVS